MTLPTTIAPRSLSIVRASFGFGLALLIAVGCGASQSDGSQTQEDELSVSCPANIEAWAPGTTYKVGELVSFKGKVFSCRQAHTAVVDWFPDVVLALWLPVQCNGAAAPPAAKPTVTAPPAPPPPPAPSSPPPPAHSGGNVSGGNNGGQCVGGPKFDPAGAKNVGNGHGGQFIGGQCLSTADCASGCCAKPCGICSGPGAQFQAGKQGCGFGG